jgi:hypothetical protein
MKQRSFAAECPLSCDEKPEGDFCYAELIRPQNPCITPRLGIPVAALRRSDYTEQHSLIIFFIYKQTKETLVMSARDATARERQR